jgi:hypothetical protein
MKYVIFVLLNRLRMWETGLETILLTPSLEVINSTQKPDHDFHYDQQNLIGYAEQISAS